MPGEFIDFECADCEGQTQVKYGDEKTNDDGRLICEDCVEPDWPVTKTLYVHDEQVGWRAIKDVYGDRDVAVGSPTYEVAVDVVFHEDGDFEVVGVNGKEVVTNG